MYEEMEVRLENPDFSDTIVEFKVTKPTNYAILF